VALATIGFNTMTFREIPARLSVTEETFGFDPMTFEAFALDMSPDQGEVLLHAIGRCVAGFWNATNLHIGDHGIAIVHENDHGGGRGPDCTMTFFSYDQLRQVASQGYGYSEGGTDLGGDFLEFAAAPKEPVEMVDRLNDPEADLMRELCARVRRLQWEEEQFQVQRDLRQFQSHSRLELAA
jgi:hypothetical protein